MLDLNFEDQEVEFEHLRRAFAGKDVYLYLKSEDQQWYREDYHGTQSIHWREICKHPWMSMTVKSNGEAAMCMEDFNNEIILGDVRRESLADIWNGERYRQLRWDHLLRPPGIKCTEQCDMPLVGDFLVSEGEGRHVSGSTAQQPFSLADKNLLVTGAAGLVGRQVVKAFLEAGGRVVGAVHRAESIADVQAEFAAYGDAFIALAIDIADDASVSAGMAETVARLGRLDVLVNNAGIDAKFDAAGEPELQALRFEDYPLSRIAEACT